MIKILCMKLKHPTMDFLSLSLSIFQVAGIVGRADLLCALLVGMSLLCYVQACISGRCVCLCMATLTMGLFTIFLWLLRQCSFKPYNLNPKYFPLITDFYFIHINLSQTSAETNLFGISLSVFKYLMIRYN